MALKDQLEIIINDDNDDIDSLAGLLDERRSDSFVNVLHHTFSRYIKELPRELLLMTENELIQEYVNTTGAKPSPMDWGIHSKFWAEYYRTLDLRRKPKYADRTVSMHQVYEGVCPYYYFLHKFLTNPVRVAWLVHPYWEYRSQVEALIACGTSRYWEIINSDLTGKDGKLNVGAAQLFCQTMKDLTNRAFGTPVLRTEGKMKTVAVNLNAKEAKELEKPRSIKELESKIRHLEVELNKAGTLVIEGEVDDGKGKPEQTEEKSESNPE